MTYTKCIILNLGTDEQHIEPSDTKYIFFLLAMEKLLHFSDAFHQQIQSLTS